MAERLLIAAIVCMAVWLVRRGLVEPAPREARIAGGCSHKGCPGCPAAQGCGKPRP